MSRTKQIIFYAEIIPQSRKTNCFLYFAGHEYATDDLDFASHVDPDNEALKVSA